MDAAQHGDRVGVLFLGDLQQTLGFVDRGRDGGGADDVRLLGAQDLADLLVRQVVGHGIDEAQVRKSCSLRRTGQIGDPGRRPVAGDLGAARMVVGMQQENSHGRPRIAVSVHEF